MFSSRRIEVIGHIGLEFYLKGIPPDLEVYLVKRPLIASFYLILAFTSPWLAPAWQFWSPLTL